jgi:hypothetical protein
MYGAVRRCTVLYGAVQCCTWLYGAVQCCTWLYGAVRCCTVLYGVVRCCTALYGAVRGCAALYGAVRGCTALYGEKSWSSLVLVPASVAASSHSDSESTVYSLQSGGSGTGRYIFYNKCSFLLYGPLPQKWSVIEQFGYRIWIQQRQVYKDHPSFLEGGN